MENLFLSGNTFNKLGQVINFGRGQLNPTITYKNVMQTNNMASELSRSALFVLGGNKIINGKVTNNHADSHDLWSQPDVDSFLSKRKPSTTQTYQIGDIVRKYPAAYAPPFGWILTPKGWENVNTPIIH